MAVFRGSVVHNRLLAVLTPDDFALLEPKLERVPLDLDTVLIEANQPIQHVVFPESGIVSTVANTDEGRIEVGFVGREGLVGIPIILGTDQTPHTSMVQAAGEGLRISADDLRAVIQARPSIFRPLGLYTQALIIQMGQTAYANATFNIEARLARWLLMAQDRTGGSELLLKHEFIAMMLGVRRPGVTTATHVLEGMQSIRAKRGRITVTDREKLLELAGDAYQVAEDEYERLMANSSLNPAGLGV